MTYLSGLLRWTTRVAAYDALLTDAYPPFSFDDDPTYPVRVAVPEPQLPNRFTVFFLAVIAIPAGILSGIVVFGAYTLMAFFAWLTTLVAGQLPSSFHLAYVAVLRFHARCLALYWTLTPDYPGGLYGDKPGAVAWADQPGYGAPPVYGSPQGYGDPQGYGAPAAYGPQGGYGVRPFFQPTTWLLPLTSAAKNLVTTFIVLGSVFFVGYIVLYATVIGLAVGSADNTATAITANSQLVSNYSTLSSSITAFQTASANCTNLTCVTKENGKAASAFSTFSGELANVTVPSGASADKAKLAAAATAAQQDYTQLSETTSVAQYQSTIASTHLQQTLAGFDADFNALTSKLQTY